MNKPAQQQLSPALHAEAVARLLTELSAGQLDWRPYCQPVIGYSGVDILRLDQLHPLLSGNKALKLAGWWQRYRSGAYQALITFGGCYSNHLHATAALAYALGIPLRCLVRGYAAAPLTPTLQDCVQWGAQLEFLDRRGYAARYEPAFLQQLADQHQALVIPEGGAGIEAALGCRALANLAQHYDQLWLAAGSGTTAGGIQQGLQQLCATTQLRVVNVVADQGALAQRWRSDVRVQVIDGALGGFAKQTPELIALMSRYDAQGLPLDPVYTAKLMYAFEQYQPPQDQQQDPAAKPQKVLLLHSGGLQGRADRARFVGAWTAGLSPPEPSQY